MTEQDYIRSRFYFDISRFTSLIILYQHHAAEVDSHWPGEQPDLLRAAVVLLHASLEDLFRSIAAWKLPVAPPESLDRIPLASVEKDKPQFTLTDLAEFRGQSVDSVIARSVARYLERSNFNHPGDLTEIIKKTGIDLKIPDDLRSKLAAMMKRRHWIVHRVDRDPSEAFDPGWSPFGQAILPELVTERKDAVIEAGRSTLAKLQ